jgi:uncharacterized membrane protein YfcA
LFTLGLIASFGMGVVLSLLGAGGSILTMPILVYLFSINIIDATSYSLLMVGLTALFGSITYLRKSLINLKVGIIFGIPSILGVVVARKVLVPYIPNEFWLLGIHFTKSLAIMLLFAVLMIMSATLMIRNRKLSFSKTKQDSELEKNVIIVLEGLIVGQLTGFVGAGGGFLIIPALVLLTGLEMKIAIGTSLFIIAIKSIIGFGSDLLSGFVTDWTFVLYVLICTLAGVITGSILSKKFSDDKLKKMFGYMTLLIGAYIIVEQSFFR